MLWYISHKAGSLEDHGLIKGSDTKEDIKTITRVSCLVRQEVWGPPRSPAVPGQSPDKGSRVALPPMKLLLYLKLQGYFGYENDRTHVIKVVVLVVKITIQLTYGIHGFKKKTHTTTCCELWKSFCNILHRVILYCRQCIHVTCITTDVMT